ncbi:helix-turn-helix domain-containing protein [Paenibacillus nanensis]|uniref:Helix-turn-helix domain-containing protein n=1 Tax=Paenibacillus nanensis TaxID=393251 RepID=A0A3A1VHF3_9BACL|nr:helix-turn-helix domain-containing protein [Paenibacillus nanensis]RIX60349.1 helix-turn-helix domain-containing protein [Paenibacillus nanensis]
MRSGSFLYKLTIFGFLLSTLPVIFIGVFAYITSSNEIENRVHNGKMQLLMQTSANVEQILTTVNHTLNQVVNSTVMRKAMEQPLTVNDFMTYNDLSMELRNMQSFDTRVEDVILINMEHNWMIKNSGLYRFDDYEYRDQLTEFLKLPEDTVWMLGQTKWYYSEESAGNIGCPHTISLVKKLPTTGLDKYALAIANIPTCTLSEFLQYEQEAFADMMILDDQNRILLHPNEELIGRPVEEAGLTDVSLLSRESSPFTAVIGGKDYSISVHGSAFNGWKYVSAVSVDSIMQESRKIGMYTIYVCALMLVLSLLIAWIGSRRMYTPIQKLLRQMKESLPEIPGFKPVNEFQMISEQVQHLFQSNSKLESEVSRHLQQVQAFSLIQAYQGQIKPAELTDRLLQYEYRPLLQSWRSMAVITLQIDTLDPERFERNDIDLLLFAVQNVIEELIEPKSRLAPVTVDQTLVTLLGSADEDTRQFTDHVYELTEHLQSNIQQYLHLQVSIGISLPFHSLEHLPLAYREGLEALKQRIKLGEGIIIQYEKLNSGKHYLLLNYPNQTEADLLDAIKLSDADKSREQLKQLLQAIFSMELSPQDYQIPLARLLNNLIIAVQESGIGMSRIHETNESLYEELFELQIAHEIEEWFWRKLVEPLVRIFRDRQNEQYHNISEKIIDLIQRKYDTDLTLEECAAMLHYNANYLSSVFRKETNLSFSEYLTTYRFMMAKRWLAETDMSIKDIASRLQYNNPQNFIRSFRKLEGMTPGQFRSKHIGA